MTLINPSCLQNLIRLSTYLRNPGDRSCRASGSTDTTRRVLRFSPPPSPKTEPHTFGPVLWEKWFIDPVRGITQSSICSTAWQTHIKAVKVAPGLAGPSSTDQNPPTHTHTPTKQGFQFPPFYFFFWSDWTRSGSVWALRTSQFNLPTCGGNTCAVTSNDNHTQENGGLRVWWISLTRGGKVVGSDGDALLWRVWMLVRAENSRPCWETCVCWCSLFM